MNKNLKNKKINKFFVIGISILISIIFTLEIILSLSSLLLKRSTVFPEFNSNKEKIIFCIGDSFTYGQGLERNNSYPMILQRLLVDNGIKNVEIINLGLPGRSSSYALYTVASIIKNCTKPSIMLVLSGWNANNNDFQIQLEEEHKPVSIKNRFINILNNFKIYRFFKQLFTYRERQIELNKIQFIPMSEEMSLYNFKSYQEICLKNLKKIASISKNCNKKLLLLNYPNQNLPQNPYNLKNEYYHLIFGRTPLQQSDYIITDRKEDEIAINSIIRYVAEKNSIPLIDIHAAFDENSSSNLYQSDWHHPTEKGASIMAETIYKYLQFNNILN
jgi:lysophospholipase L1-like esterase